MKAPEIPELDLGDAATQAALQRMVLDLDVVERETGRVVKIQQTAMDALNDSNAQLEKAKGLAECLAL